MVKFGGYDEFCMKNTDDFKLIETQESDKWSLSSDWGKVGTAQSNIVYQKNRGTPKKIIIEPQLPYIYISQADYRNWVQIVNA